MTREHLSKVGNVFTILERVTFPASRTILETIRIVLCSVPIETSGVWGDILKGKAKGNPSRGIPKVS